MKFKRVSWTTEYIVPDDKEAINLVTDWITQDITDGNKYGLSVSIEEAPNATWTDVHTAIHDFLVVQCKFCKRDTSKFFAHKHQKKYVCEECWDERLKITE